MANISKAKTVVTEEPVLAAATLLALLLGTLGVVTDASTVANVLAVVLPILSGLLTRLHVVPKSKVGL